MKEMLCKICHMLFQKNLVSGTDGNISIRAQGMDAMYITPSGVNKGLLEPEQILLQGFDGKILEGTLRSTKEAGLHSRIYRERPDVGAVVHTHPACATAFAACGMVLPRNVLIEAPVLLGDVALAPYAKPGSQELVQSLDGLLDGHDILFLQNHGVIVCGKDIVSAFSKMDALENVARSVVYARLLGGAVPIPPEELAKL